MDCNWKEPNVTNQVSRPMMPHEAARMEKYNAQANTRLGNSPTDTPKVERQPSQVERSMSDCMKSAAVLAELVANLEQRLAPILRPMPPTIDGPISKDEPTCGLAEVLNGLNNRIAHSNNFIARMLDCLEL